MVAAPGEPMDRAQRARAVLAARGPFWPRRRRHVVRRLALEPERGGGGWLARLGEGEAVPHCRRLDGPGGALLAAQREVRAAAGPEQGGCLVQEVCDQHAVASRVRRLVGQAAIAEVWIVKNDVVVQPGRSSARGQLRRGQRRGIDAVPNGRPAPFKLSRVGCSVSVGGDQLLGGGQHCGCQLDHTAEGTLQCERVREVTVAHDKDSARLNDRCHEGLGRQPLFNCRRSLWRRPVQRPPAQRGTCSEVNRAARRFGWPIDERTPRRD